MRPVFADGARFEFPHTLTNQFPDHAEEFRMGSNGGGPDHPQLAVFGNCARFRIQVV